MTSSSPSPRVVAETFARNGLKGASLYADPYPTYAWLRTQDGPVQDPVSGAWLLSRYNDVQSILADPAITKCARPEPAMPLDRSILYQDPPGQTRMRRLVTQAIGPALTGLDARIHSVADTLITRLQSSSSIDFIASFALPLPITINAGLLGILDDLDLIRQWQSAYILEDTDGEQGLKNLHDANLGLADFFGRILDHPDAASRPDIIGGLVRASSDGETLSRDEIIANCILLLVAGHETTVNLLGNGLYLLLQQRERFERLQQEPALLSAAIEEMLRFEAPVQLSTFRGTTAPILIGGRLIPQGAEVIALIASANRDPEYFSNPDLFAMDRKSNRHLSFGHGLHRCIGSAFAHAEARIAFAAILERLPHLRLDQTMLRQSTLDRLLRRPQQPRPLQWRQTAGTRGLKELHLGT